jgi:predicted nucleic acid-binding protein
MDVLIDTNVILDVLLQRIQYASDSTRVLVLSERGLIDGFVSASSVTDIFYIVRKALGSANLAIASLRKLTTMVNVASVSSDHIDEALNLGWNDFEDSIQYVVGKSIGAEYIITRNKLDFRAAQIKIISPEEFLNIIGH